MEIRICPASHLNLVKPVLAPLDDGNMALPSPSDCCGSRGAHWRNLVLLYSRANKLHKKHFRDPWGARPIALNHQVMWSIRLTAVKVVWTDFGNTAPPSLISAHVSPSSTHLSTLLGFSTPRLPRDQTSPINTDATVLKTFAVFRTSLNVAFFCSDSDQFCLRIWQMAL